MTMEELRELRKKVIENRESLRILNHQYNEMLEEKHSPKKRSNNVDSEKIKKSKAYKIMVLLRILLPLSFGTLFTIGVIPMMILLLYILISPFIGATFEVLVLPKIVFGRDYKVLENAKATPFDQKTADELYAQVSSVREEYHKLRHEFEEKVAEMGLEDSDEYKEYLKLVDAVIETIESENVTPSNEVSQMQVKELNLQ